MTLGITIHGIMTLGTTVTDIMIHGTMVLGPGVGVIPTIPGTQAITGGPIIMVAGVGAGMTGAGMEDLITVTTDMEDITEAVDIPHILTEEAVIRQAVIQTETPIGVLPMFQEIMIHMEE